MVPRMDDSLTRQLSRLVDQISTIVVGKRPQIEDCMACLLAGGHLLIEDVPGVGKTTLAHALAVSLGLDFRRVQFTADLMPSDLIGVSVFERAKDAFVFHQGPVFAQVLLADEINRAGPKTQSALLEAMGHAVRRPRFKALKAHAVEGFIKHQLQHSTDPDGLTGTLRRFFRYCAVHRHTRIDFSGLIPPIRRYRHASLPKGLEDSALEKMLRTIPRETPIGARDYAIVVLLMAYGIRGISAAQLLLEDLDWQHARIRIRAQKGGKEVVLPLMQAVGEALIQYLQHRPGQLPCRKVFLSAKAPYRPLDSVAISMIVRRHLKSAGVQIPGSGTRTLRHSWAIRALAHDSPIKAIADVLGHRYIDTTFIYAKADLKSLRQVALPWPVKI